MLTSEELCLHAVHAALDLASQPSLLTVTVHVHASQAETRGQRMRPAEPARVMSLKYIIGQDADADTMAIMRLVLDDEASPLAGREFEVEMPPPHHGQAEFVMLRSRFEAAMARGWHSEDACKVRHAALPPHCGIPLQHHTAASVALPSATC